MMAAMSSDTERQVVEAIMIKSEIMFSLGVESRDFRNPFLRSVFDTMGEMVAKNIDIDEIALHSFNPALSVSDLAMLEPISSANAEFYATQMKEQTIKRDAEVLFTEALRRVKTERHTQDVISDISSELLKISEHRKAIIKRAKDIVEPTFNEIREAYESKGELRGVPSGYSDIDEVTDGFRNGNLIILAARPSIGKTTLALNMADHMDRVGKSVGYFSAEMSEIEIMQRLFACAHHINLQAVRSGLLAPADFSRLGDAVERFAKSEMWIDDTPSIHFTELRNKARTMKVRGVEVIFIDFLTLINFGEARTPKWERVGNLIREIKALARELNVPIIALSQLGRQAEAKEPSMADLRQSGEIEEAADIVMLMHRARESSETVLNIAKNRNGPTERVGLFFVKEQTRFEQLVHRGRESE